MARTVQISKEKWQSIITSRHGLLIRKNEQTHLNIHCSEETVWIRPSWSNCCKETTTKEHQYEEETCLVQETQAMDIRPVEICLLVWWVQNFDFWFQPQCLRDTQSRWTDELHVWIPLWGMEEEVWWCFAGDTVCNLLNSKGTLNQHGYHNILQRYAIPSGLCLVGLSFVFQQNNDPKHTPSVQGLFDQGEWWSAASDDLTSIITQPQPNWGGLGWVGLQIEEKAANNCSTYVGTLSRLLEKHSRWLRPEAGWENAKSV
jgi:hypothetical protein